MKNSPSLARTLFFLFLLNFGFGLNATAQNVAAPNGVSACVDASSSLPTISSFKATPGNITSGQSSTLSWSTSAASSVSLDPGIGVVAVAGNYKVWPAGTTTYTLTAKNPACSVTQSFVVTLSGIGRYTISSQEPITLVPNPTSMFAKPLPSNILSHLAVANAAYPANSDTMVRNQMGFSSPGDRGAFGAEQAVVGGDQQPAKYYGQPSDPYYEFTACTSGFACTGLNVPFHAPSGAKTSAGGADKFLVVWDQTNNNVFVQYEGSDFPACPGNGRAGTLADPCPISNAFTVAMNNFNSITVLGNSSAWTTMGILPLVGQVRMQEVLQGHIYHALYLDTGCTSGTQVYPNTTGSSANSCANQGNSNTNGIPNGALVFLDYTPTQLADLKTKLDAWQYPYIEAMTLYGGYIGDTASLPNCCGIYPSRNESEQAYNVAGIATPHPAGYTNFYTWLASQPHSACSTINGGLKCLLPVFENVPAEPNNVGGSGTDIVSHMHVADQCVAKAQAGAPGGCQ
jgi:hypothetical protein